MKTLKNAHNSIQNLNKAIKPSLLYAKPPEILTVSEWADKYRIVSPDNSSEPGRWRTSRTPYMKEPMDAFTDPLVRRIDVVASSQVGKTEMLLNMIGYVIDNDPGTIMMIQPTDRNVEKFSKTRFAPFARDTPPLKNKIADVKSRSSGNTITEKSFPGGMLTFAGSNSPAELCGTPSRYVFGDERDRWAVRAGTEGDPWSLLEARTLTYYNSKMVEVSTPTVKGYSAIEASFYLGTQERWHTQCPDCDSWHVIDFDDIKYDSEVKIIKRKKHFKVKSAEWVCPDCGGIHSKNEMMKQPSKWISGNPDALTNGVRSFWITGLASPWVTWEYIALKYLQAEAEGAEHLQPVWNTLLGRLWEANGEIENEDELLERREKYDADLPEGVLSLTCGVDTQGNRLEYEIVGHGRYGETWGIKRGVIPGRPDSDAVWIHLDEIIDRTYKFKDGTGLIVSATFIDSGGHYGQDVYKACRVRFYKKVFAIKGSNRHDAPFISKPSEVAIKDNPNITCWLYMIGVDSGKATIMSNLKVMEKGANYCHFPLNEGLGYDESYFTGLLSERLVFQERTGKPKWEKIPGRKRNEPLDCRNYALAAFKMLDPDLDKAERCLKGLPRPPKHKESPPKRRKSDMYDDW